jgi:hypothetical protein
MTASQHTPSARRAAAWQAARRAARALRAAHDEQVRMWEAWLQENRAAVPEAGPLSWVLTSTVTGWPAATCRSLTTPLPMASHDRPGPVPVTSRYLSPMEQDNAPEVLYAQS